MAARLVVATDKRLILTYGLVTQKVAMMPLTKVTDMSYNRSPSGACSATAPSSWRVPARTRPCTGSGGWLTPDRTYRAICAEMFGVVAQERLLDETEDDHRFTSGPPSGPDTGDYATAIRIRSADSKGEVRQALASSDSRGRGTGKNPSGTRVDRDASRREADTRPIFHRGAECD